MLHVMRYNTSYRVLYSRSSYTYMYLVVVPGAGTQTVEMRESILVLVPAVGARTQIRLVCVCRMMWRCMYGGKMVGTDRSMPACTVG